MSAEAPRPPAVALEWSAPQSGDCPAQSHVLRELNRHLSRSTVATDLGAKGKLTREPDGRYRLVLTTSLKGQPGERVFEDSSCRAVTDAAVIVLAWMVDPNTMAGLAPKTLAPRPAPHQAAPKAASQPRREPFPFVELGAQLDLGSLPSAGLGAELHAGAWLQSVRLAAFVGGFAPQRAIITRRPSDGTALGGEFGLLAFGVEACPVLSVSRAFRLVACAGPELEWMRAAGLGVTAPTRAQKAWVAVRLGSSAALSLSRAFSMVLGGRAVVPSRREYFALHNVGVVHRPSVVSVRASLALEVRF